MGKTFPWLIDSRTLACLRQLPILPELQDIVLCYSAKHACLEELHSPGLSVWTRLVDAVAGEDSDQVADVSSLIGMMACAWTTKCPIECACGRCELSEFIADMETVATAHCRGSSFGVLTTMQRVPGGPDVEVGSQTIRYSQRLAQKDPVCYRPDCDCTMTHPLR